MNAATKNIIIILGLFTVGFAGYYLYVQTASVDPVADEFDMQAILAETEAFIAYSQELDSMSFDLSVFEDARFNSLREFTTPIATQPVGKTDPFSPVSESTFINTESE
jgi:hypothetical protein